MTNEVGTDDDQTISARLDRLNRDFYSADPSDYFDVRLLSLMLLAGRPDDVLGMLANGVTYGHMYAEISGGRAGAVGVRNFASIESQVLLHQVCETLIRLHFAHAGHPPCPWLEVAGERSFDRFKMRVRWTLKKHITPYLGGVPLGNLTTPLIREWRAKLLAEGVSPGMVAKAYRLLRAVLWTAVREDELLPRNPCRIPGADRESPESGRPSP